jgi:DNA-binding response OmpR family regulator
MSKDGSAAILLVDDHEDTVRVLQKLLRMSGFEVRVARTAGEALEVAAECPCDLVVSDVGLPDRSGLELVGELKRRCGLKAVALSGFTDAADAKAAVAAGFDAHLKKPVHFDELLGTVRRLLADGPA